LAFFPSLLFTGSGRSVVHANGDGRGEDYSLDKKERDNLLPMVRMGHWPQSGGGVVLSLEQKRIVPNVGLEPTTTGLRVLRSTN
jgi:hypothetical protein